MKLEINRVPNWDGGDNPCLQVVHHDPLPCRDGGSDVAKSGPANRLYFGDNLDWLGKMRASI